MKSRDFKERAKEALKGKWFVAIIAAFIASAFGVNGSGVGFSISLPTTEPAPDGMQALASTVASQVVGGDTAAYIILMVVVALVAILAMLIGLIISCIVRVGYAQFNLDLIGGSDARIRTLFSRTSQMDVALRALLLMIFRVFLGSLLIIPGIVMAYSYSMVDFVLADNPDMGAREALSESRRIMRGNRFKLFCLGLSFIGPALLCVLTLGIGFIWFLPYQNATMAAFYEEARKNA